METEYISREAALDFQIPTYDLSISAQDERAIGDRFEEFLESIPAADVRPVVRGEWLEPDDDYGYLVCSVCEERSPNDERWHFCPNCGADMREDGTDG